MPMKKFLSISVAAAAAMILCGCGHTPSQATIMPAAIPPQTASADVVQTRSAGLKNILLQSEIRGIGVYPAAFAGRFDNEYVLDIIEANGFNRIYCRLTSEQELDEQLAQFVTMAVKRGFQVETVLSQQDFFRRYRSNRLIRNMLIQFPDLSEAVSKVVKFNQDLPDGVRLSGVTVVLTPHLFNGDNEERIKGQLYSWSDKRYGIGEDNDMLMRDALNTAKAISEIENLPELTIAIADFYHEAAAAGKLSCGKISDFAAVASRIILLNSANLPSQLPQMIQDELAAMPDGKKAVVAVRIAGHTSIDRNCLRRRNWTDLQNSVNYLIKKSSKFPTFGGVIISPLAVVEYLRQEK